MTLDFQNSGGDSSLDGLDHWLDAALCAVPLPDGFFTRLRRIADASPHRVDDRDRNGHVAPLRDLAGAARRYEASPREIWPR